MTVPTEKGKPMFKNLVHDQIKILLERMDTHPEEFIKEGKWDEFLPPEVSQHRIVTPKFKHFTKLEQYLVRKKYKDIVRATLRQRAYDSILETLVFKEEPTSIERFYSTSNTPVLGTPTIYEATVDAKTGKMTEKIHRTLKKAYGTSS